MSRVLRLMNRVVSGGCEFKYFADLIHTMSVGVCVFRCLGVCACNEFWVCAVRVSLCAECACIECLYACIVSCDVVRFVVWCAFISAVWWVDVSRLVWFTCVNCT